MVKVKFNIQIVKSTLGNFKMANSMEKEHFIGQIINILKVNMLMV